MTLPDITEVSIDLLLRMNKAIPRYTSYPTAPEWHEITAQTYQERLALLDQVPCPLSLYVHIPFCRTMCLFCGCSVILNRRPENEERYVAYLCKEFSLVSQQLHNAHTVGSCISVEERRLNYLFPFYRCLSTTSIPALPSIHQAKFPLR